MQGDYGPQHHEMMPRVQGGPRKADGGVIESGETGNELDVPHHAKDGPSSHWMVTIRLNCLVRKICQLER